MAEYLVVDVPSGAFTQVVVKKDGKRIMGSPMELTGSL